MLKRTLSNYNLKIRINLWESLIQSNVLYAKLILKQDKCKTVKKSIEAIYTKTLKICTNLPNNTNS